MKVVAFGPENGVSLWNEEHSDERLTKVEEELHENVEGKHCVAGEVIVCETPDDEENGEADESHQLNWLTSDSIDGGNCHPVTFDRSLNQVDDAD